MRLGKRSAALAALIVLGGARPVTAAYMTQDQSFTASASAYWQPLFYDYTHGTTTTGPVHFGRTTVSAPWLVYSTWYGLFLYDYTTGRFEEGFYYRNERI